MKCSINMIALLVLSDYICGGGMALIRNSKSQISVTCPVPKLKNGSFRMRNRGRGVRFTCARGFEMHGPKNLLCQMGRWEEELPICIKTGCKRLDAPPGGLVGDHGTKAFLFCDDGHINAGNAITFCDGNDWDRKLGECRLGIEDTKSCDFETNSICGWATDLYDDFKWVRKNGWSSFERLDSGPKHDHTRGKPLDGYYMVAEATNQRTTHKARLYSPIYNESDSINACFRFYYHMYGAIVGRLRVYIKPLSVNIDEIADTPKWIYFEKQNSQGNQWNEEIFHFEPVNGSFQIVFEASGSRAVINDIAIDDVALMKDGNCMKYFTTESVIEETDGIYDIQSCMNRCNETQSIREIGPPVYRVETSEWHLIEKCDCHWDCVNLGTCCFDYKSMCGESDIMDSTIYSTEVTVNDEITTINAEPEVPEITVKATVNIPPSTITTPKTTTKPTNKTTQKFVPTKTEHSTTTKKTTLATTKLSVQTEVIPKVHTYKIKPTTRIIPTTVFVRRSPTLKSEESKSNIYYDSVVSLSIIALICGISILLLIGWKYLKYANKWNRYNSQSIEYKSNYYSKRTEEPLMTDEAFNISDFINDGLVSDENESVAVLRRDEDGKSMNDCQKGTNKPNRMNNTVIFNKKKLAKIRKPSLQLSKDVDRYCDELILSAEDDSIDFSLQ